MVLVTLLFFLLAFSLFGTLCLSFFLSESHSETLLDYLLVGMCPSSESFN